MATLRGEEVIARCFKNEGVDTIFFMMGGPTSGTAGARAVPGRIAALECEEKGTGTEAGATVKDLAVAAFAG